MGTTQRTDWIRQTVSDDPDLSRSSLVSLVEKRFELSRNAAGACVRRIFPVGELPSEGVTAPPDEPEGIKHSFKSLHYYNEADDKYVFWLRCRKGRTDIIDGEVIREAKRMYSRWEESGTAESINEICQKLGWPRVFFVELKTELGWTHDQDPFTTEEHISKDTPEIMKDLEMLRRGQLERERNKEQWRATVADAKKWRDLEASVLAPMFEDLQLEPRQRVPLPPIELESGSDIVVFAPFDAHVEKLGVNGDGIEELRKRLLATTEHLCHQLIHRRTRPKAVVVVLGSDWWNADTEHSTTTSGTAQDCDGLPEHGLRAGLDLQIEYLDSLRRLGAPILVRVVPGNHDWRTSQIAHWGLSFGYRNVPEVSVHPTCDPFQYHAFGNVLIGFHHGHIRGSKSARESTYALRMAKHEPSLWADSIYRYQIVGHRHELISGDQGVMVLQTPSLATTDRWHRDNVYDLSTPGQACFVFNESKGLVSILTSWI